MILHPNPMIVKAGRNWEDTHLKQIVVKHVTVKSIQPDRWVVMRRTTATSFLVISRHITEYQALVIAQRIANRLYKPQKKKTKTKALPIPATAPAGERRKLGVVWK